MMKNVMGVAVLAVAMLVPVAALAQQDEPPRPYVYGIYYQCDMTRQELAEHSVLVVWVHRVDATDHQHEVDFQSEALEACDQHIQLFRERAGEERDLHTVEGHG